MKNFGEQENVRKAKHTHHNTKFEEAFLEEFADVLENRIRPRVQNMPHLNQQEKQDLETAIGNLSTVMRQAPAGKAIMTMGYYRIYDGILMI